MGSRAVVTCVLLSLLSSTGCALIGPSALRGSRPAYNDAIVATNNQQLLSMIVRMRYGEPAGLLAVTSITANLSVQGRAGSELGIGSESNYEGNLVPLSAGLAYEENPTISYVPVQGEAYIRQLFSPLPLDLTMLVLQALHESPQAATLLLRSVNGIRNPGYLWDSAVEVDPRFDRLARLLARLVRQGHARFAQQEPDGAFALVLTGEGIAFTDQVGELYGLLGFATPDRTDRILALPLRLDVAIPQQPAIHLETRSIFDLLNLAAATVDVPDDHLEAGIADPLPPLGPAGEQIRIHRSRLRPADAMVAIRHRGWWYSIGANDGASKRAFRILESLVSVRIADAVGKKRAVPMLTVPVSR